jgi:hypothetical protein
MESHFLENVFGLVRRSSFGNDQSVTFLRVIVKASTVAEIMHDLDMKVISSDPPEWTEEMAEKLYQTCKSSLYTSPTCEADV